MDIDILPVGPILTNCYLVTCRPTRQAVLIDPGWNDPSITEAITRRQAVVKYILNTHAHFDHVAGNAALVKTTGARLALHEDDLALLRARGGADTWNIPMQPSPEPDLFLKQAQMLEVGQLRFKVLFTPGHTPGHVSFYEATHGALFDGDVLFHQGIGRTDLPGGSTHDLMNSIRVVLFALPDDVTVYPGHGPETTIGDEKRLNPWVRQSFNPSM